MRPTVARGVGVEPDGVEHLVDLRPGATPCRPISQMSSPSATMSPTLRRGFSDEIGSWKIICIRGRTPAQLVAVQLGELHRRRSGPGPTWGGGAA